MKTPPTPDLAGCRLAGIQPYVVQGLPPEGEGDAHRTLGTRATLSAAQSLADHWLCKPGWSVFIGVVVRVTEDPDLPGEFDTDIEYFE